MRGGSRGCGTSRRSHGRSGRITPRRLTGITHGGRTLSGGTGRYRSRGGRNRRCRCGRHAAVAEKRLTGRGWSRGRRGRLRARRHRGLRSHSSRMLYSGTGSRVARCAGHGRGGSRSGPGRYGGLRRYRRLRTHLRPGIALFRRSGGGRYRSSAARSRILGGDVAPSHFRSPAEPLVERFSARTRGIVIEIVVHISKMRDSS